MTEAKTVGERYASATESCDLSLHSERRADADVLLAAGMSGAKSPRAAVALLVLRIAATGDARGLDAVIEQLADWIARHQSRRGGRPAPRAVRRDAAAQAVAWWMRRTCGACDGLGFLKVIGAPALSATACPQCGGSGKRALSTSVALSRLEMAQLVVDDLDALAGAARAGMRRLLGGSARAEVAE